MTLQDLKNNIERICKEHKQIVDFQYGEDFLVSTEDKSYPLAFLEIPYNETFVLDNRGRKQVAFALLILMTPTQDDIVEDHQLISEAEQIAEAIVIRMKKELKELGFTFTSNPSLISLRKFRNDDVAGVRVEINGEMSMTICNNNYQQYFNN